MAWWMGEEIASRRGPSVSMAAAVDMEPNIAIVNTTGYKCRVLDIPDNLDLILVERFEKPVTYRRLSEKHKILGVLVLFFGYDSHNP